MPPTAQELGFTDENDPEYRAYLASRDTHEPATPPSLFDTVPTPNTRPAGLQPPGAGAAPPLVKTPPVKKEVAPPMAEALPVDPSQVPVISPPPAEVPAEAPVGEKKTVHSTRQETFVKPTKEEEKLEKEREELEQKQQAEAEKAKQAAIVRARADADAAEAKRVVMAESEKRTNETLEAYNAEVARREAVAKAEDDTYRQQLNDFTNTDPKTRFWASQSTPQKITSVFGLLIGVVGSMSDGRNVAAERIENSIKEDTERYRTRLQAQKEILERSRGDVKDTVASLDRRMKMVDLRTAAALDAAAGQAEVRAKRLGIDEAEIKGNEGILSLRQKANALRLQYQEGLRRTVKSEVETQRTTGAGVGAGGKAGEPTQGERDAAAGLQQLSSSLSRLAANPALLAGKEMEIVQKNEARMRLGEGRDTKSVFAAEVARKAGVIPKSETDGLNDDQKAAYGDWMNVRAAIVKTLNGVGASDQEKIDVQKRTIPAPGDSPRAVAAKLERAKEFLEQNRIRAGRAAATVPGVAASPAPAGRPGDRRGRVNGKPAIIHADGSYTPLG